MDNTRNNNTNVGSAQYKGKVKSKIMPIYIVKKDHDQVLNRKKINFQINYGHTYHISYKYFTPKGYTLAPNSTSEYTCKYDDDGMDPKSITFTYVKDSKKAEPISVNYIDIDNNQKLQTGYASGTYYGENVNVLNQTSVPEGYRLCPNQRTSFKVNDKRQSVYLMVKKIAKPQPKPNSKPVHHQVHHEAPKSTQSGPVYHAKTSSNPVHVVHKPVSDHNDADNGSLEGNIKKSIHSLESNLQRYDCDVAVKLIHEVLDHNLDFFRKVVTQIFTKMKYKDINNLKTDPQENKISGVIKKYLYNNNHVNFTFVRARKYGIDHQVTISEVRDFVTSVTDHNSSKGIFITTSRFSPDARKEAERHSIILIDDMKLAKLMIQNNVGVKSQRIFRIVNLDKDFFK